MCIRAPVLSRRFTLSKRALRSVCRAWAVGVALALTGLAPVGNVAAADAPVASVPYVPTPQIVVDRMLAMANVRNGDYLIDLGSGDGRIVVTAARRFGTRGFGVDLNPVRISEAEENARKEGVADKVSFMQKDLFQTDLSDATVITMYLLPRVNLDLRPRLLKLKPGTRLVSHDFDMAEWKPDAQDEIEAKDKYGGAGGRSSIFFWVVPAPVQGRWQASVPVRGKDRTYEVDFAQSFQQFSGTVRVDGKSAKIERGSLKGPAIVFTATVDIDGVPVRHEFAGTVDGEAMSGRVALNGARLQSQTEWSAKRVAAPAAK